jgi:hypothetical protein
MLTISPTHSVLLREGAPGVVAWDPNQQAQTACGREVMKGSVMIDTIATFLSTVVELLQTGITGFVDAVAGLFV